MLRTIISVAIAVVIVGFIIYGELKNKRIGTNKRPSRYKAEHDKHLEREANHKKYFRNW